MELPQDVVHLIREFSKPLCRIDWRNGSYVHRHYTSCFYRDIFIHAYRWKKRNLAYPDYIRYLFDVCDDLIA
jgi:hypothetical protein